MIYDQERHRVKKLLGQEESMVPALFANLRKAFIPLMHDDTYEAMSAVVRSVESNTRQTNADKRKHTTPSKPKNNTSVPLSNAPTQLLSDQASVAEGDSEGTSYESSMPDDCDGEDAEKAVTEALMTQCTDGYCAPCYEIM